jgi:hypothetical protein
MPWIYFRDRMSCGHELCVFIRPDLYRRYRKGLAWGRLARMKESRA